MAKHDPKTGIADRAYLVIDARNHAGTSWRAFSARQAAEQVARHLGRNDVTFIVRPFAAMSGEEALTVHVVNGRAR